jgi:molybdopterin-guanine dinucleotide biosynthesis protein
MQIITVSGTHSGIGKTLLIEKLLKQLKGWSCLKVTVMHKGTSCPIGRNCGACDNMDSKFCIVTDKKILSQEDKDTYRYKKAGAKKVLWLKAQTKDGLKEGLKKAIAMFDKSKGLIIEGTSILKYLDPDVSVLLVRNDLPWKESAKEIIADGRLSKRVGFFIESDMQL